MHFLFELIVAAIKGVIALGMLAALLFAVVLVIGPLFERQSGGGWPFRKAKAKAPVNPYANKP